MSPINGLGIFALIPTRRVELTALIAFNIRSFCLDSNNESRVLTETGPRN